MPIKIDDQLPARHNLELENIFVMTEQRASLQDIRPLKILMLNLMPHHLLPLLTRLCELDAFVFSINI